MALTVRQVVEIPALKTRLLAGRAGEGRVVRWAHSCELEAPWEWLGQGDLLMTNGFPIPSPGREQVRFVQRLEATGIAAVALGEHQHVPELAPATLAEADRLAFPILRTAYDVPFIAIAQAVAQAARSLQQQRMTQTMRIYEAVRESARGAPSEVVSRLERELGARLYLADHAGAPLLDLAALEEPLRDDVAEVIRERGPNLPAVMHLHDSDRQVLLAPVPSSEFACLVVRPSGGSVPELAILQHVAAVLAIELERASAQNEMVRRLGSDLLGRLIDRSMDADSGSARLAEFGLPVADLGMLAMGSGDLSGLDTLDAALRRTGTPHVRVQRGNVAYALLPNDAAQHLDTIVDRPVAAGCSPAIRAVGHIPDAALEARWALEAICGQQPRLARYGIDSLPFMPRTVTAARDATLAVLGELLRYDDEHSSELLASLRAFLSANRSWQRASSAIGIHKQTLVYRMRRVEQLTGRRLDNTADVAQLWMALASADLLDEHPVGLTRAKGRGDTPDAIV